MFQFSRLALFRVIYLQYIRLSHSEIFGLSLVCSYPKLIAAYHVLLRLLVPRHPPYALICFKILYSRFLITTSLLLQTNHRGWLICNCFPNMSKNFSLVSPLNSAMFADLNHIAASTAHLSFFTTTYTLRYHLLLPVSPLFSKSGGYRIRTDDPLRARQVL